MVDISSLKKHMFDIIGAIYDVHKELGAGLNEYCYQEGFQIQLDELDIPYQREMTFHPTYHGKPMQATYRVDFLCKDDIIVECKAVDDLDNNMRAQLYNYMRLLKHPCGILVNFASKLVKVERYFYDKETNEILAVDGHAIHQYR
jgi:GxxExxY protein